MNPSAAAPSAQAAVQAAARASKAAARPASKPGSRGSHATPDPAAPPSLGSVLDGDGRAVVIAIPASAEFVRVVRLAVAGVATRMRFSYEQIEDIKLAVSEACNNAILHAELPEGSAPAQVVVRIRPGEERLEITVFDQGRLPSPGLELPQPAGVWQGLDDLPEGGMGLMLIQALMDEVSSHTGAPDHTALHMVKLTRPR